MLKQEKRYDFKKELLNIHKKDVRDFSLIKNDEEFELKNGIAIVLPEDCDDVIMTAAGDFQDYLLKSMRISSMLTYEEISGQNITLILNQELDEASGYMGYRITVLDDGITIEGYDSRGVAQALYFMEDLMNLRKAPFLKKKVTKSKALFSPRLSQSPFGMFAFTDECFAYMAHRGYDAISLWIKGMNLTNRGDYIDLPLLCERAAKYGIDIYIMLYQNHSAHPDDPGAQEFYDKLYAEIFEACPLIKGVELLGEANEFGSHDPNAGLSPASANIVDNIPTGKRSPGYWPCSDYPQWVDMVKKSVRKYRRDAEVIFYTYNWSSTPEEDRLKLVRSLPTDIILAVGWEMCQEFQIDGVTEFVADYTMSIEGPSTRFKSEAAVAKQRGIRVLALSNSAGRTWDFGVIPYEPVPYQWIKRFKNMNSARGDYNLTGLMECIHYGFQPSFIGDLEKWATFSHEESLEEILKALLVRDFGEENLEKVDQAMVLWSEGVTHLMPAYHDQYGALRIGPSYPLWIGDDNGKIPAEFNAMFGNSIYIPKQGCGYFGERSAPGLCVNLELREIKKVIEYLENGISILESIEQPNDKLLKLINLGKFMYRTCITVKHCKEAYILEMKMAISDSKTEIQAYTKEIEQVLLAEKDNVEKTIPIVKVDSYLGWEPSMEYMGDEKCLRWKLRQLEYVQNTIMPLIHQGYMR